MVVVVVKEVKLMDGTKTDDVAVKVGLLLMIVLIVMMVELSDWADGGCSFEGSDWSNCNYRGKECC